MEINNYQDFAFSDKTNKLIEGLKKIEPYVTIKINICIKESEYSFSYGNLVDDKTYFQIGSNTKLFTAALINKLIMEGKVKKDEQISKYLPLNNKKTYPTIENLLNHFGYRPLVSSKFIFNWLFKRHNLYKNLYKNITNMKLLSYLRKKNPPKKLFYYYSDMNYAILALVAEVVCKENYHTLMENFIKNDLCLNETVFYPKDSFINSYHKRKNAKFLKWNLNDIYKSAGGLWQTANDAYKFVKMSLSKENKYASSILNKNKTIKFGKIKMGIGYGWHCYVNGNYFFHKGGVACYRVNYFVDKAKNACVCILSNVIGNKFYNTTSIGMSIHADIKKYIKTISK